MPEAHERPTFAEILDLLEEIACSSFVTTPQDSFHIMQEDWKGEIENMMDELKSKEKVQFSNTPALFNVFSLYVFVQLVVLVLAIQ